MAEWLRLSAYINCLQVRFSAENEFFCPFQKIKIYILRSRLKAEFRSTGNKYNFFSPPDAKRSVLIIKDQKIQYTLLSTDNWGNCSDNWPKDFHKNVQYSATKCKALCRAQFFNSQCGCSPMVYNIEGGIFIAIIFETNFLAYPVCTANDLYSCLRNKLLKNAVDKGKLRLFLHKFFQ